MASGMSFAICASGSPAHMNSHLPPTPPTLNACSSPAPTHTFSRTDDELSVFESPTLETVACIAEAHRAACATHVPRETSSDAVHAANSASPANLSTSPPRSCISRMAFVKHAVTTLRASSPVSPATPRHRSDPDASLDLRPSRSSPRSAASTSASISGSPPSSHSNDDDDENDARRLCGRLTLRSRLSTPRMAQSVIGTYPQMSTATTAASIVNVWGRPTDSGSRAMRSRSIRGTCAACGGTSAMPCVSVRVTEQAPRFGKSAPSEKRFWLWPLDLAGPFAVPTLAGVSRP